MATATLSTKTATKKAPKVKEHVKDIEITYEDGETLNVKKKESEVEALRAGVVRQGASVTDIICHEKCWCQKLA